MGKLWRYMQYIVTGRLKSVENVDLCRCQPSCKSKQSYTFRGVDGVLSFWFATDSSTSIPWSSGIKESGYR